MSIVYGRPQGPASEHLCEIDYIRLGITGAHAECVQFQKLAREVFVEALAAIDPGDRVRADRLGVVRIDQHCRMALGGNQHVHKAAEHVRADRFAFVAAGHDRGVEADAKMVRPEPHQALYKADLGLARGIDPRLGLSKKDPAWQRQRAGPLRIRHVGCLGGGFHARLIRCATKPRELRLRCARGVELENRAKRAVAA